MGLGIDVKLSEKGNSYSVAALRLPRNNAGIGQCWAARRTRDIQFGSPFRSSSTVEQAAVNRKVQGSNPCSGAKI